MMIVIGFCFFRRSTGFYLWRLGGTQMGRQSQRPWGLVCTISFRYSRYIPDDGLEVIAVLCSMLRYGLYREQKII